MTSGHGRIGQIHPADDAGDEIGRCGQFEKAPRLVQARPGLHQHRRRHAGRGQLRP